VGVNDGNLNVNWHNCDYSVPMNKSRTMKLDTRAKNGTGSPVFVDCVQKK